jgi:hypothetical protein
LQSSASSPAAGSEQTTGKEFDANISFLKKGENYFPVFSQNSQNSFLRQFFVGAFFFLEIVFGPKVK